MMAAPFIEQDFKQGYPLVNLNRLTLFTFLCLISEYLKKNK